MKILLTLALLTAGMMQGQQPEKVMPMLSGGACSCPSGTTFHGACAYDKENKKFMGWCEYQSNICIDSTPHATPNEGKCAIKPAPRFVPAIKTKRIVHKKGDSWGCGNMACAATEDMYEPDWECSDPERVLLPATKSGKHFCLKVED